MLFTTGRTQCEHNPHLSYWQTHLHVTSVMINHMEPRAKVLCAQLQVAAKEQARLQILHGQRHIIDHCVVDEATQTTRINFWV